MRKLLLFLILSCSFAFSQITVGGNAKIGGAVTMGASSGGGGTTFTHAQGGNGVTLNAITCAGSGGTGSCTSNVASGALLIVLTEASADLTISSDSQSLTWHPICAASVACGSSGSTASANGCLTDGGGTHWCSYYAATTSSGAETVNLSGFAAGVEMDEYHRSTGTWTFDVSAAKIGSFSTACASSASASVAGSGELIIGSSQSGGTSVTFAVAGSLTTLSSGTTSPGVVAEGYTLSGSTGAQNGNFTLGTATNNVCSVAAFK